MAPLISSSKASEYHPRNCSCATLLATTQDRILSRERRDSTATASQVENASRSLAALSPAAQEAASRAEEATDTQAPKASRERRYDA